ncbi:MAG TPA: SGNH/GDSL hydrolase family protein [Polyangiales bacterium]|nr:SGNH/GDSL hydrolase family protein [Polyangiales bacterium]
MAAPAPSAMAGSPAPAPNTTAAGAASVVGGASGGMSPAAAGSGGQAGAGTAMAGSAAMPPAGCEKGKIKASEVIVIGESFYAINRNILNQIEKNAKAAQTIGMSDSYRNYSVSGQLLTGTIPSQFDKAIGVGPVKVVIMDGGGNDCMSSPCDMCPGVFEKLLKTMADNRVENVIYTRYPEPGNPPGSLTTLKKNLDILMPKMEAVCMKTTAPKCHWVDLRPVWKNGDTTDGLHPTVSGGQHVGDAIWAKMVEQCIAQ